MEKDRTKDIKERYAEAFGTLNPLMANMLDSHRMVAGQQWYSKDAANSRKKNIAPLTYNYLKGQIDIVVGIQRQTRTALKAYAEETGDDIVASIASTIMHHELRKGRGYIASSMAFKDACIGGLGWISPYMNFSEDPESGDFKVISDSPFDIFFDPHGKEMDASDFGYMIKRKVLNKDIAKALHSAYAQEIDKMTGDYKSDYYVMEESGLKNKVVVKEMWERGTEEDMYIAFVDETGQLVQSTVPMQAYNQNEQEVLMLKQLPTYNEFKISRPIMNLVISINDELIVYDGKSPYGFNSFPFIPVFGFYDKSMSMWKDKLQSLVDPLKDSQREINKWNSNMMHYVLSSIHSGWIMDKGAVDDERILTRGMSVPVIRRNPNKTLERIQPPVMSPTIAQMYADNEQRFNKIGLAPDALGMVTNAESAKAIQLRQMSGLSKIGELTDNFNIAYKQLGTIALSMIFQFYTHNKLRRILGREYDVFDDDAFLEVKNLRYDIEVDETTYNPTSKRVRLESLTQMQQYGVQGIEAEDFYELWDIDAAELYKLKTRAAERRQAMQQAEMEQKGVQTALLASKAKNEQAKTDNMNTQTAVMAQGMMKEAVNAGVPPEILRQEVIKNLPVGQENPQAQPLPEPPIGGQQ